MRAAALAVAVALACAHCAGSRKEPAFLKKQTETVSVARARPSDTLGGYRAFEFVFTMEGAAKSMRVTMSGASIADPLTGNRKPLKVFFVIEKAISVKQFKQRARDAVFSEIARNYDTSWGCKKTVTVSPPPSDPMRGLGAGALFRVRFTSFSPEADEFTVTVESDPGVVFTGMR